MGRAQRGILIISIAAGCLVLLPAAWSQSPVKVAPHAIDFSRIQAVQAPSAERLRILEQTVITAPAMPVPVPTQATAPPPASSPEPVESTEKGKLYHVDVLPRDEKTISAALASQPAIRAQGISIVPLPGVLRQQAEDGGELLLKPFVIPQKLIVDAASGRFIGSIKVGVSEIGGPAAPRDLSVPVAFQVLDDGVATPDEVLVRRSGLPLTRIGIATADAADGLTVTVASPFNPEGVPVTLQLGPSLHLAVDDTIEGLGLEATTVAVSVKGLAKPAGKLVQIMISGPARAEQQILKLDENGDASTQIRSVGTGTALVTASLPGFQPAKERVSLTIPYLTFAASAVGGIVGGLIRLLPGIGARGGMRRFWLGLLVALLVGVVVFALYAIGVNLLPFTPKVQVGTVLVFAVSAAGAYFGSRILGRAPPKPTA